MSRDKAPTGLAAAYKTAAQCTLIELRKELGMTQQDLAVALRTTVRSVARWETASSPSGQILKRLEKFAAKRGCLEHAAEFHRLLLHEQFLKSNHKLILTAEGHDLQAAIALAWRYQRYSSVAPHWAQALHSLSATVWQILNGPRQKRSEPREVREIGDLHKRLSQYALEARQQSDAHEE